LILLLLVEQQGAGPVVVHAFGVALVVSRVLHAQCISSTMGRSTGRFYGSVGTLLVIAGLAIWLVVHASTTGR
jgi:uncharacterized membrane protein YecN with MAPEG domain